MDELDEWREEGRGKDEVEEASLMAPTDEADEVALVKAEEIDDTAVEEEGVADEVEVEEVTEDDTLVTRVPVTAVEPVDELLDRTPCVPLVLLMTSAPVPVPVLELAAELLIMPLVPGSRKPLLTDVLTPPAALLTCTLKA